MDVLVRFDEVEWESRLPGVRLEAFTRGEQRLRLLRFEVR
jgi:hypothetical protein